MVRITDPGEFLDGVIADITAPEPTRAREDCPICRDIPPVVTSDDPWPPNADRLKDAVSQALRECEACRRLYAYSYWFKFGEVPEATLKEVDRAQAVQRLVGAAAVSPWALQREDGTWVLRYDPTAVELTPLLSPEERDEVEADLENLPHSLRDLEGKLRRLEADLAVTGPWLKGLEDERVWLHLDSSDHWYLWRGAGLGVQAVRLHGKRVQSIVFWFDFRVRSEVKEALRKRPDASLEAIDKNVLARLRSIDEAAVATLARIEAGEAWPRRTGEVIAVGGAFYAVRAKKGEATPVDPLRLREWLAGAARSRASLASSALAPERRQRLEAILDPARQLALIRQGRLTLYSDRGSTFDFRDGHFARNGDSGLRVVSETEAQAILDKKRYSWMKWR